METYLSVFESYLAGAGLTVAQVTLGIIGFLALVTVLALISSARSASQLNRERTNNAAGLAQTKQQLQSAQTQIEGLQQQASQRVENLRKSMATITDLPISESVEDWQALSEDALWETHANALQVLTEKCQAGEEHNAKLLAQNHDYKNHLDQLELARLSTFNDLNLATQKINDLEQSLQQTTAQLALATDKIQQLEAEFNTKQQEQQDNALAVDRLRVENAEFQANLDFLQLEHKQTEDRLVSAADKIRALEAELADKTQQHQNDQKISANLQADHSAIQTEMAKIKREHVQTLKDLNQAKHEIADLENALRKQAAKPDMPQLESTPTSIAPAEAVKQPGQLFGKFIKTIKADLSPGKRSTETALPEQTAISPDSNLITEKDPATEKLKAEPAARADTSEPAAPNRPAGPFDSLLANAKLSALTGAVEKMTRRRQDSKPQPPKPVVEVVEKVDEIAKKGIHVPEQLKSIYQKLISSK